MRLVLVLLAALLLAPALAHAQQGDSRNPKELLTQAERLDEQKKSLEAAALLEKASESTSDARLIYDIARAYEQAGQEEEAISHDEKCLSAGKDAQQRKRSQSATDRPRKEKGGKTAAAAESKRKRQKAKTQRSRRAKVDQESQRLKQAYEDAQASRKRMQVASIALGGMALASAGVGTFFGLKSRDARTDFDAATELESKLAARTATRNNAVLADIGFGVGLVSAVAAILLYPKGPVPQPGKPRLTGAPQGNGVGLEVSF
jgi:tetratricopeptide (TPR) repeat protein